MHIIRVNKKVSIIPAKMLFFVVVVVGRCFFLFLAQKKATCERPSSPKQGLDDIKLNK